MGLFYRRLCTLVFPRSVDSLEFSGIKSQRIRPSWGLQALRDTRFWHAILYSYVALEVSNIIVMYGVHVA